MSFLLVSLNCVRSLEKIGFSILIIKRLCLLLRPYLKMALSPFILEM